VRNKWQKQNIGDISKFFLFRFDANNVSATNLFKKVTAKGVESNNLGVEPQAAGGQWRLGGGALIAAKIFQFFSKN